MVIRGMRKVPDDEILEEISHTQVHSFKLIAEDMAHYNRLEEDDKERNYAYLYESFNRCIKRTRREKVRAALSKGLSGLSAGQPAAPVEEGKAKGKGKGKDKGKKRSSSAPPGEAGTKVDKPCSFFAKENCTKGNDCLYQHDP